MKGTAEKIIGQKSGFAIEYVFDGNGNAIDIEMFLNTGSHARDQYDGVEDVYVINSRKIKKIQNCLFWMIQEDWIQISDDKIIRNYVTDQGLDATLESLNRSGVLYDFGSWRFLAPLGWE